MSLPMFFPMSVPSRKRTDTVAGGACRRKARAAVTGLVAVAFSRKAAAALADRKSVV